MDPLGQQGWDLCLQSRVKRGLLLQILLPLYQLNDDRIHFLGGGVVPFYKSVQYHPHAGVGDPHHCYHFTKGDSVWCRQGSYIRQFWGAAVARYDLVLVNAGLQNLHDSISVLQQAELMKPRPQIYPVVEA